MTSSNTHTGLELARQMDRLQGREPEGGAAALVEEILTGEAPQTPTQGKKDSDESKF